jgi:hypothetical protein
MDFSVRKKNPKMKVIFHYCKPNDILQTRREVSDLECGILSFSHFLIFSQQPIRERDIGSVEKRLT